MKRRVWWVAALAMLAHVGVASAEQSRVGASVDLGVPDGVAVGATLRASERFRFELAGNYNTASFGFRVGATWRAFDRLVAPTFTVEGGHLTGGDATRMAGLLAGDPDVELPFLKDVSYQFANGHLGVELGRERATFYVRGGISVVHARMKNAQETIEALAAEEGEPPPEYEIVEAPRVWAFGPSARIGLVLFF